jgi:hypothetical protein
MPQALATRTTRVVGDGSAAKTISAGTIRVNGIVVANTDSTALEVNFTDADDTTILTFTAAGDESTILDVIWLADNGLKMAAATPATIIATVFHGYAGS